jgi:hypothetical protein
MQDPILEAADYVCRNGENRSTDGSNSATARRTERKKGEIDISKPTEEKGGQRTPNRDYSGETPGCYNEATQRTEATTKGQIEIEAKTQASLFPVIIASSLTGFSFCRIVRYLWFCLDIKWSWIE